MRTVAFEDVGNGDGFVGVEMCPQLADVIRTARRRLSRICMNTAPFETAHRKRAAADKPAVSDISSNRKEWPTYECRDPFFDPRNSERREVSV